MLTGTQIGDARTGELEDLAARIDAELTRRELGEKGDGGREVVEERPAPRGCYRLERVACGKDNCRCAEGEGHGPYWYQYVRRNGRLTSRYVGKELPGGFS